MSLWDESKVHRYLQILPIGVKFQPTMVTEDQVLDFVSRNKVRAKKGFICVDGRYSSPKFAGMLARPGGNFRGIMALLALRKKLGMTVGRIVDRAVDAVEEMGITFNMHTDHHSHNEADLAAIGCGHIAKAEDPKHAPEYHVNPRDIHNALVYLRIKLEGRKYFQEVNLQGDHQEKGVLIITGTKNTVNHWDKEKDDMYFVFDKARDDEYQKKLFGHLHISKINFTDFKQMCDLQLNATLNNLAKGLPIYEVNLDNGAPDVKYIGKV
jgi:hypothetical protein